MNLVLMFKDKINPFCLLKAQRPLSNVIISDMFYSKKVYYVVLAVSNESVMNSYISDITPFVTLSFQGNVDGNRVYGCEDRP